MALFGVCGCSRMRSCTLGSDDDDHPQATKYTPGKAAGRWALDPSLKILFRIGWNPASISEAFLERDKC